MLQEKFINLRQDVSQVVLERNEEIHTAILAIVSKTHHFQIGLPGVAKSYLIDEIVNRIEMEDEDYFKYLMQNFTLPEEVFGPANIKKFVEEGVFELVTTNKLPRARIAFLDEIFKSNSAILNTLLMIINEREFVNPTRQTVPLMSLFAASNELPGDPSLKALWDRLHFRHEVIPMQQSSSFIDMLDNSAELSDEAKVTMSEIEQAQAEVASVKVGMDIMEIMNDLRLQLRSESIEPSARRWRESLKVIRASTWMNGNETTDIEDLRPLIHILWSEPEQRKVVTQVVLETVSPLESQATKLIDDIDILARELDKIEEAFSGEPKSALKGAIIDVHKKLKKVDVEIKSVAEQAAMADKTVPAIEKLQNNFKEIGQRMVSHFAS